jgi:hypothetical protein
MQTFFGLHRRNLGLFAVCLVGGALSGLLPATTASAADPAISTDKPTIAKVAPAAAQKPADPPPSASHWTFSAEAIALSRAGSVNQALVGQLPGATTKFDSTFGQSGVEALNANQLWQRFAAGPKIGLTYRGDSGYGLEFSYFSVFDLSAAKAVGPDGDWLLMTAPGTFSQTQDFPYQAMKWKDTTSLHSVEVNGRLDLSPRVTLLAGLRWLQLNDQLQGTLTPSDRGEPYWKYPPSNPTLAQVPNPPLTTPVIVHDPFWTAKTTNNLYGAQIGLGGQLWELGRFSLDGVLKAGVYDNVAEQSAEVSMQKQLYPTHAATNAVALVGEAGLHAKYRLSDHLALKVGYEALWLDGVALAPGQIRETYTTSPSPVSATALGVNHGSNALFQGATAGLELSF